MLVGHMLPLLACCAVIISGLQSPLLLPIANPASCLGWCRFEHAHRAFSFGCLCSNMPALLSVLADVVRLYHASLPSVTAAFA